MLPTAPLPPPPPNAGPAPPAAPAAKRRRTAPPACQTCPQLRVEISALAMRLSGAEAEMEACLDRQQELEIRLWDEREANERYARDVQQLSAEAVRLRGLRPAARPSAPSPPGSPPHRGNPHPSCPVCAEERPERYVALGCGHVLCEACSTRLEGSDRDECCCCPFCRCAHVRGAGRPFVPWW